MQNFHEKLNGVIRRVEEDELVAQQMLRDLRDAIAPNLRNARYAVSGEDSIVVAGKIVGAFLVAERQYAVHDRSTGLTITTADIDEATTAIAELTGRAIAAARTRQETFTRAYG